MSDEEKSKFAKEEFKPNKLLKRKIVKSFRQRVKSKDSEDPESGSIESTLYDLKEMQSLRKRARGVSLISLALGKRVTEDETVGSDPFAVHSGGLVNMQAIKSGKTLQIDDAYETGIGTQFSVETNKRDEDEEMMKYIEEQLSKRKGTETQENCKPCQNIQRRKYCSPEEAALQAVPIHLRESSTKRSEEMLSNQMLSGIPEVDLGIDVKIKNIEATEEAKLKLLWEKQSKQDVPSQFVPSNMAVNFTQHSRFNIDDTLKVKQRDAVGFLDDKNKTKKDDKATDDYHYERFKKQFRKY